MKITTQGDYGLRCVMNIAQGNGSPVTIEEICQEEELSKDYVEQLLLRLRRSGIVKSQKGPGGGYLLGKEPRQIKVEDIVRVLEKNPFEIICAKFKKRKIKCHNAKDCKLKALWQRLAKVNEEILSKVSIADLVK